MAKTLDYSRASRVTRDVDLPAGAGIVFGIYVMASFVAMTPGLHNEHPFLVFWYPVAGVTTAVIVIYGRLRNGRVRGRLRFRACAIAWAVGTLFGCLGISGQIFGIDPHSIHYRDIDNRRNLVTLGTAVLQYAAANGGKFPSSLETLIETTHVPEEALYSRWAKNVPAGNMTVGDVETALRANRARCVCLSWLGKEFYGVAGSRDCL